VIGRKRGEKEEKCGLKRKGDETQHLDYLREALSLVNGM